MSDVLKRPTTTAGQRLLADLEATFDRLHDERPGNSPDETIVTTIDWRAIVGLVRNGVALVEVEVEVRDG